MTKLYKLTDKDNKTRAGRYNETLWGAGVTHTAPGNGELCSNAWLHAYTHPLLAVLFDISGAWLLVDEGAKLWEADGEVGKTSWDKVGCTKLTTLTRLTIPQITNTQRIAFAILCGKAAGCSEPDWIEWAEGWLSGRDRSYAAAAAAAARWAAADAARWAAAAAAARWAAAAAAARWAAADAARWAAADAAAAAAAADRSIDFVALAEKALNY